MVETIEHDGETYRLVNDGGDTLTFETEDEAVLEVREIAADIWGNRVENVERLDPQIIVELDTENMSAGVIKNLFAGGNLVPFLNAGYVARSVSKRKAWFVEVDDPIEVDHPRTNP